MKKLIFVTVTVLAILTLPYAQAQTTLTVNTFGAKWPQRTIGVNIPPDNEQNYFVDNMALHAMQKWNAAMNWFMETYYPSENVPLELVQSSSGQVTVVITYRNNYELSGSTTYLQTEGYFTQMTVQLLLSTQETVAKYFPSTEDYIDNVLSLVTHEFGHVLGLGEAPSTETYDIMCMRVLPSSQISTLDLYGILEVSKGFQGTVILPSNIPYSYYYNATLVPEFPYQIVLLTCVVSICVVLERSKLHTKS